MGRRGGKDELVLGSVYLTLRVEGKILLQVLTFRATVTLPLPAGITFPQLNTSFHVPHLHLLCQRRGAYSKNTARFPNYLPTGVAHCLYHGISFMYSGSGYCRVRSSGELGCGKSFKSRQGSNHTLSLCASRD
jgi:hypothetical protein